MSEETEAAAAAPERPSVPPFASTRLLYEVSRAGVWLSLSLIGGFFLAMMVGRPMETPIVMIQFCRVTYYYGALFFLIQLSGVICGMASLSEQKERSPRPISLVLGGLCLMGIWFMLSINLRDFFTYNHVMHYSTNKCLVKIASAVEDYARDNGEYPPSLAPYLTTPVAYLRRVPRDPYGGLWGDPLEYGSDGKRWVLVSRGPDMDFDFPFSEWRTADAEETRELRRAHSYTTRSSGDGDFIKTHVHENIMTGQYEHSGETGEARDRKP